MYIKSIRERYLCQTKLVTSNPGVNCHMWHVYGPGEKEDYVKNPSPQKLSRSPMSE
jgi:hypothetical protein